LCDGFNKDLVKIEFEILTESARLRISVLEDRHDATSNKRSPGRAARLKEFIDIRGVCDERAQISPMPRNVSCGSLREI
jgi:hypothetical protein